MQLIHYKRGGILMCDLVTPRNAQKDWVWDLYAKLLSGEYERVSCEEVSECPHECKAFEARELVRGDCDLCYGGKYYCRLCGEEWQEHDRWCPRSEERNPGFITTCSWKVFTPKNRQKVASRFDIITLKDPGTWIIYHPKGDKATEDDIEAAKAEILELDGFFKLAREHHFKYCNWGI